MRERAPAERSAERVVLVWTPLSLELFPHPAPARWRVELHVQDMYALCVKMRLRTRCGV